MTTAINKSGELRKPGSGRKSGSTSFSNVPLSHLKQLFANDSIQIPISRLWLEAILGKSEQSSPQVSSGVTSGETLTQPVLPPITTPAPTPSLAIRDLNEED